MGSEQPDVVLEVARGLVYVSQWRFLFWLGAPAGVAAPLTSVSVFDRQPLNHENRSNTHGGSEGREGMESTAAVRYGTFRIASTHAFLVGQPFDMRPAVCGGMRCMVAQL